MKTFIFLIFYIDVVPIPAGIVLGIWFLLQILNVGMGGGMAWFAHIGGFLAGILLIRLALGKGFRENPDFLTGRSGDSGDMTGKFGT